MKSFVKNVLASLVALVIFGAVLAIMSIISMAGLMATDGMGAPVMDNTILKIKLSGTLEERAKEDPVQEILGEESDGQGLDDMLMAIHKAKDNDKVLGIYLQAGSISASPAMLQELRDALLDFKESGKFVVAYGDSYSQGAYYVSTAADKVFVNPEGMVDWHGLASNPIFYKDVLEKVGVKMQVFKVGTFKSAVEPFTCTEMSDANREQVTSFLGSIWKKMLADVGKSRHITTDKLNELADSCTSLRPTTYLLKSGMVDSLLYIDEVKDYLTQCCDLEEWEDVNYISVKDMASSETLTDKHDGVVAVYYAYGDIVEELETTIPGYNDDACISASKMTLDLKKLREDEDVKAVVIRVNSGGGSAYASEQIWHEVELLKAEKPVVISMGGMAASGGYYISCGANKIYAEPTTLTGSIGIFGMIPDATELLTEKIGLKFDVVKTNAMADFGAMGRPFNEDERRLLQARIENGYELFTGRVAMGRKMKLDKVKEIAEGRVWTGEQALKIGLVDKLGDLDDAIVEASRLAKIDGYNIGYYPEPTPWYEEMLKINKESYIESQVRGTLGEYYPSFCIMRNVGRMSPVQARLPYDLNLR